MLRRSNFVVACLLAGTTSASFLDSDQVNDYQRRLSESRNRSQAPQSNHMNSYEQYQVPNNHSMEAPMSTKPKPPSFLGSAPPTFKPKPKPPQASAPIYTPSTPKPKTRDPFAMCVQYTDPVIF